MFYVFTFLIKSCTRPFPNVATKKQQNYRKKYIHVCLNQEVKIQSSNQVETFSRVYLIPIRVKYFAQ